MLIFLAAFSCGKISMVVKAFSLQAKIYQTPHVHYLSVN